MNHWIDAPYPTALRWMIPHAAIETTARGLQTAGRRGQESGAVWLGMREETSHLTTVVLLQGLGVEENRNYWHVSPDVFASVTRWAAPRNLCLLALVHTHVAGVPPKLSWTDRRGGIRVPGVLAIVIGGGGSEYGYQKWGWHVYQNGDFHQFSQSELGQRVKVVDSEIQALIADANGVLPLVNR